jgi:hypothetical protein
MTTAADTSPTEFQETRRHTSDPAVWKDARQVRDYFGGRSAMWLHRKKSDPTFPVATYFGNRQFYRVSDIVAWEQRQIERSAARSTNNTPD